MIKQAILAVLLFAPAAAPAQTVSLTFHRSELASAAGRQQAIRRIDHATSVACFESETFLAARRACRQELSRQMLDKLGDAAVTAEWRQREAMRVASR